ncbi:hypothetical protein B0H17DRAFT_1202839 [Mycena rosella]|uniref:Uncharacterized protein n=1 Tax=Mycena rosella TaxID=1033263 RepID=A0AAD7GFD7_MYCRO|nr:hypothetical protein B0H17DRAFT_1202839 [Mycena rosella]
MPPALPLYRARQHRAQPRDVWATPRREVVAPSGKMRYAVETLLIPKQHATSDMCAMDKEEGVLEPRELITLGWFYRGV